MTELNSSLCQLNWLLAKGGDTNTEDEISRKQSPSSKSNSPRVKDGDKPPYSYSQLIRMAIENSPQQKCTLNGIYNYISGQFSYYKENRSSSWRNSIRHNLSLNKQFRRLEKREGEKGSFWVCAKLPEKKPKCVDGSSPRVNPMVEKMYKNMTADRASTSENVKYAPFEVQPEKCNNPANISLFNNQPHSSPAVNGNVQSDFEEDISDLSLFESHDLSSSFRKVYDQVFQCKSSDRQQKEAQIDWLKISLETAGLDYRNDDELLHVDTDRFSEYILNGFPELESESSTPRTCTSRVLSREMSELSPSPGQLNNANKDEESEDEFDWNTIV